MNVSNLQANAANRLMAPTPDKGQAANIHDLTKAVRTGDIDGAKQAYKSIIQDAPEGATWPKDSAFAKLGVALATGHGQAAKAILVDAVRDARSPQTTQPMPDPVSTATTGAVGGSLNVTA